jgi:hypothetical protein
MRLVIPAVVALVLACLAATPASSARARAAGPAVVTAAGVASVAVPPIAQRRGARPRIRRSPSARRPVRNRRIDGRRIARGILQALGIAFLLNMLFGWGPGGSPLGLLLLGAIVLWLVTRRRRRRPAYPYGT